jgi:hypothetical protein
MYDIKIDELKLPDGSLLWKTFVTVIVPKRNAIAHDGETATPDEADLALECANALRKNVVVRVARKMDFDLEKNGSWHNHVDAEAIVYEPKALFERLAHSSQAPSGTPADPDRKGLLKFGRGEAANEKRRKYRSRSLHYVSSRPLHVKVSFVNRSIGFGATASQFWIG